MNSSWGRKKEEFYAGDSQSGEEEDEEYEEVLRLQQIRGQKMKVAAQAHELRAVVEDSIELRPFVPPISSEEDVQKLMPIEELPKGLLGVKYGQELIEEYSTTYHTLQSGAKGKYAEMKTKLLKEYAGHLLRLIHAKAQNREAADLVEDVLLSRKKLGELEKLEKSMKALGAGEERRREQRGRKRVAPEAPKEEAQPKPEKSPVLAGPEKRKKTVLKTHTITSSTVKKTQSVIRPAPVPSSSHSYLSEYLQLNSGNPAAPQKEEEGHKKTATQMEKRAKINAVDAAQEDEFYQSVLRTKQEAKESQQLKQADRKEEEKKSALHKFSIAQRNVNYNIMKSKGLTRKRKKIERNPRAKLRMKYNKAVQKRKHAVKEYQGKMDSYGGESTGIRSTLIKSTKL